MNWSYDRPGRVPIRHSPPEDAEVGKLTEPEIAYMLKSEARKARWQVVCLVIIGGCIGFLLAQLPWL